MSRLLLIIFLCWFSFTIHAGPTFSKNKLEQDILSAIDDAKLTQKKSIHLSIPVKKVQSIKTILNVNKPQIFTIVIDPGHGGKDTGAIAKNGEMEKTVVLAIAKKLADKINQSSNMRAILTRDDDYFLSLRERLRLARKYNADLFMAIHADAYFKNASGASVYALSQRGATSEAARWLAQRENYSELDDVELDSLQDKSLMLRSVLIDMAQTSTTESSVRLGEDVLNALDNVSKLHDTHVEQAPFMVLKSPDIPSILVETGFITNPKEAKRLANTKYQNKLALALFQGVNQYIKQSSAQLK